MNISFFGCILNGLYIIKDSKSIKIKNTITKGHTIKKKNICNM